MDWNDFLAMTMDTIGIGVIVGFLISVTAEYWPKYGELSSKVKRLVFIGLSFLVPALGFVAGLLTGVYEFIDFQTSIFSILVAGFAAAFAGEVNHIRYMS